MAYTLNTAHPLYGNIIELIGVQGGALVSHKVARTFTLDSAPAPTFGSGTWGEHFVFAAADSATSKGASLSPAVSFNTYDNPTYSVFIAINTKGTVTYDVVLINGTLFTPFLVGNDTVRAGLGVAAKIEGATPLGAGARSFCTTATIGTSGSANLYLDGASEGTPYGSNPDTERTGAGFNGIGQSTNTGAADGCSVVWVAVFDKVLSQAEVDSLNDSLGANNAFGLVESGPTPHNVTPVNVIQANAVSPAAITSSAAGTLTTAPLKNNTGTLLANQTGATAYIHNMTTGALIVAKTGQTTNASGVMVVSDPLILPATQYRIVIKLASAAEGLDKLTAT
jgi:hypothetical protein